MHVYGNLLIREVWRYQRGNQNPRKYRKFSGCYYNIFLNWLRKKYILISLNFAWKGTICSALEESKSCKAYNCRFKVGNVDIVCFKKLFHILPIKLSSNFLHCSNIHKSRENIIKFVVLSIILARLATMLTVA
jgi:hypothetical protein